MVCSLVKFLKLYQDSDKAQKFGKMRCVSIELFPEGVPVRKRLFDLLLALVCLVVALPLMAAIAFSIRIVEGAPVIFRQQRPGYRGRIITVYKFRTMRHAAAGQGSIRYDLQRIFPLGRFLRATSLDELPELFNVLCGEMSLVGPRPLLVKYLERYTPEQMRRHDVLPGITGWAQVNGRNILSWEDKFRHDLWYVDHWSLGLDIKILLITFWKVLRQDGINQPGHATVEEFMGSKEA